MICLIGLSNIYLSIYIYIYVTRDNKLQSGIVNRKLHDMFSIDIPHDVRMHFTIHFTFFSLTDASTLNESHSL